MKSDILKPEVIEFIKGHLHDDPFSLSLNIKKYDLENAEEAILQIQSRQKALKKLPHFAENFDLIFPSPVSVEQSSSEVTAKFKANFFKGKLFADLTGGMGVDSYFFSKSFDKCLYVESNRDLCRLASHNFKVLGVENIEVVNETAENFINQSKLHFSLVYLDPSRRNQHQRKVFRIDDCNPNVIELERELLKKTNNVLIKLSPLADIKNAFSLFKHLKKIWVVSVRNECKELLCWLTKAGNDDKIEAINIVPGESTERFEFNISDEESAFVTLGMPVEYIYEPNVSILKSGAFKLIAKKYGLQKLHNNTHLYTADKLIDFPGRIFRLTEILKVDKKKVTNAVSGSGVNVIVRNFHLKADEVFRKFKLKSGDDKYLIATTLADNSRAFLSCDRIK